ncbi:MAG: 2-phospho-L-lactate transferase [Acidobacteriota bacterium]
MIVALAGGIGGSKLLAGLARRLPPDKLTIVGNTGDDIELFGLRICPDLDTITYTLSGHCNPHTGWGLRDDSFHCLKEIRRMGGEDWFQLGDRDLATHIVRSGLLREGIPLSEITQRICTSWGVRQRLLPMCESYAPTFLATDQGRLHFQEYLVRERALPAVQEIDLGAAAASHPGPGIPETIQQARAVILCPSNPLISIGPILAVAGMRALLKDCRAPVIAVSPIVRNDSLKGPSAKMMRELGYEVSAAGVAGMYKGLVDIMILDRSDAALEPRIQALGMDACSTATVMQTEEDKLRLADFILERI